VVKGGHPDPESDMPRIRPEALREDIDESLSTLNTTYADVFMLHRDDPAVPVGEVVDFHAELINSGLCKSWGVSNWSHTRVEQANAYAKRHGRPPIVASSPQFSLVYPNTPPWPGCVSVSGPEGEGARAWYAAAAMTLLAWSPLASGYLSETSVQDNPLYDNALNVERRARAQTLATQYNISLAQLGLAYVLSSGSHFHAIVGTLKESHLRVLSAACQIKLQPSEVIWLESGS